MAKDKIINVKIKGLADLKKLKKQIDALQKGKGRMTKETKKEDAQWQKLNKTINKAIKKTKDATAAQAKNRREKTKGTKENKKFAGSMMKTAGAIGFAIVAFRKIAQVMTKAFSTFTDFEFSMAKVRAISGATNDEFMRLNQSAKELGRTTFFTAKEVAELQVNFSKLGFSANQIISLQEATLDLAMATGSDLARSAMVAGSAVRGFGLEASEATRVVDVMAVAFTNSALDIEKWQTSMTKVSSISAMMGIDIEGTAAVMGVLSDAGIEASIAGTSLRNIFLKMANPTSALAKRIGFVVNSTESMIKALKILKDAKMSDLEVQSLVDVRQVIAFQRMLEGVDTIQQYTDALNNSAGAGQEMADIMEDSTKGAFKRFASALEGLYIVLSEKVAPWINKVTKGIRGWLEVWTDAADLKISDRMNLQVKEMKNLFKVTKLQTATDITRNLALQEINRKYGEYIGFQLEDINDTAQLVEVEKQLNAQFEKKIALQVAEEGYAKFLADQLARKFELYKLEKDMMDEFGTSPPDLKFMDELLAEAGVKAEENAKAIWGWVSDWDPDTNPQAKGFATFLEKGLTMTEAMAQMVVESVKAVGGDMNKWAKWKGMMDDIARLKKEQAKEEEDLAFWTENHADAMAKINKILDTLPECPPGHKRNAAGICVEETQEGVREFAKELAQYETDIRTEAHESFIGSGMERDEAYAKFKANLAHEEYLFYKKNNVDVAKFHLKWLKAQESADKISLKIRMDEIKLAWNEEQRRIKGQQRDGLKTQYQINKELIAAEKKMLEEKLLANKDYQDKIEKIQDQIAANAEKNADNEHAKEVELKVFAVNIAQEMADMSIEILSNQLAIETAARNATQQKIFTQETDALDRQLQNKQLTQAEYDDAKHEAEEKNTEQMDKIKAEQGKKAQRLARAEALINGALAITKLWAQLGWGAPLAMGLVVASTMAQLAVIDQQEFAKGGEIW